MYRQLKKSIKLRAIVVFLSMTNVDHMQFYSF